MQAKVWFVDSVFWPTPCSPRIYPEFSEHIMYLTALGQPIIVLNSLKAAFELLDRRANIYSDRPRHIIADILCGGRLIALMPYGDEFA
jgi:hypothetical protein